MIHLNEAIKIDPNIIDRLDRVSTLENSQDTSDYKIFIYQTLQGRNLAYVFFGLCGRH